MKNHLNKLTLVFATLATFSAFHSQALANDLVIYTARKEELLKPILEDFTKETNIKVRVLYDDTAKLIARLESEGDKSQADVLLPVDLANIQIATEKKLLSPIKSSILDKNIPAHLRDANGNWYALTKRVRAIAYSKKRVKPSELNTYENLADSKWKGKVLVRTSSHVYNQSLVSALIAEIGAQKTENWAKSLSDNLARKPQGGDTDQMKAIAAGEGDVALVNHYYYARLMQSKLPEEQKLVDEVGLFFPNQAPKANELQGTHVNVSAAGVLKNSKNKADAQKFIEFMSAEKAQRFYADVNYEFPVNPAVKPSELLNKLGSFKEDQTPLAKLYMHAQDALKITDRTNWK